MLDLNKIYCGNCVDLLKDIDDESIDMVLTSPPYDCYSDDTEVLTSNGWELIKDVEKNDKVMTINPHTKEIYYQDVINKYSYDFSGNLFHFISGDIDLLVTDNHKMFISDKNGKPWRERSPFVKKNDLKSHFLKPAKDIKRSGYMPYSGFVWNGNIEKEFFLPEVVCLYNKQPKTFNAKKIDMMQWVRFLGIFLSEGSCRNTKNKSKKIHSYEITIKQKDVHTVKLIRNILGQLPFEFKEYKNKQDITIFSIIDRQLWDYLYKFGNSFEKYIPLNIKALSKIYIEELILYMMIGDGTKRKSFDSNNFNINSFVNYKSYSKKLKDDVQECLLKIGRLSRETKNNLISNKLYKNIQYAAINKKSVEYNGRVVCLEVQEHNIICVRRNGKVTFCGNSLRSYEGYSFDFESIAKELYRVIKPNCSVVWIVGDAVIDGSETGTSFRQALYFKEIGFNLHDTMIYAKNSSTFPAKRDGNRYSQVFEYMFVFSKGKPKCNLLCDKKNKWAGFTSFDGKIPTVQDFSPRNNIWFYVTSFNDKNDHPAVFPEALARDHIRSWSDEEDIILDPMCGSGTTVKIAYETNRKYIGMEISQKYCDIIKHRMEITRPRHEQNMFF